MKWNELWVLILGYSEWKQQGPSYFTPDGGSTLEVTRSTPDGTAFEVARGASVGWFGLAVAVFTLDGSALEELRVLSCSPSCSVDNSSSSSLSDSW